MALGAKPFKSFAGTTFRKRPRGKSRFHFGLAYTDAARRRDRTNGAFQRRLDLSKAYMQAKAKLDPADDVLVLTGAAPGPKQKLVALVFVPIFLALLFVVTRPFADIQLPPAPAFVPLQTSALFVINLITAVIFFSQFSIQRSRALLVIANGYLYAALTLIPYLLAFPGLFVAHAALIGGLQSTAWLYILRHCGLAASMVAFALASRSAKSDPRPYGHRVPVVASLAVTAALVVAIGFLCIAGDAHLPIVASDGRRFSTTWIYYAGMPIASLYGLAVILLWRLRNTVLGLWLMVVASVHLAGVPLSYFGALSRFSVGWYAVVILNLMANSLVLTVLLVEISNLYRRVLQAVRAQQQEREARLITGDAVAAMIAHEIKQPLQGMILRARTSLRRLKQPDPDVQKAMEDMERITADGHRAAEIINSVRANFRQDPRARTSVDLNRLITETASLLSADLRRQSIRLQLTLDPHLAGITGNPTQLQQVLLNLLSNAAESTAGTPAPRILTVRSQIRETVESRRVSISVADMGSGVNPAHLERIFSPLYTTKPEGMGMGLAICRSIIEAHGGRIWASPNHPKGAIFEFTLEAESAA